MRGSFRNGYSSGLAITLFLIGFAGCGGDDFTGPPAPDGAIKFAAVTAGYFHSCGRTPDGRAYCWGGNTWAHSVTAPGRRVIDRWPWSADFGSN